MADQLEPAPGRDGLARKREEDDAHAVALTGRQVLRQAARREEERRSGTPLGHERVPRSAARERQPDCRVRKTAPRHEEPGASLPERGRAGRREPEPPRGRGEPSHVRGHGERVSPVRAPRVVDAVAVEEATVERRNTGLTGGEPASVQPDEHRCSSDSASSPSARRSAAVLSQDSASSRSGSESMTMPPPA